MQQNIITAVRGDPVEFSVDYKINDEAYTLGEGEHYAVKIKKRIQDEVSETAYSNGNDFTFPTDFGVGKYYFEIRLVSENGDGSYTEGKVISPACDSDGQRINTLHIIERL